MTALDMHIWYECERVQSYCETCGQILSRATFGRHDCVKGIDKTQEQEDRRRWHRKRIDDLGIGDQMVCLKQRPLVRHFKQSVWFYTGNQMSCN